MLGERMKIVISPAWGPKCGSRSPFLGLLASRSALWVDSGRTTARGSWHGPHQVAHSHQVVRRVSEQAQMVDLGHSADLHLTQRAHGLAPAEGLLDPLTDALADRVPRMSCGAAINGRAAVRGVLGHVRRGITAAQLVDEVGGVVAPIGTDRHAVVPGQAGDPVHGGRALPRCRWLGSVRDPR